MRGQDDLLSGLHPVSPPFFLIWPGQNGLRHIPFKMNKSGWKVNKVKTVFCRKKDCILAKAMVGQGDMERIVS
jgi:hypothetical protein